MVNAVERVAREAGLKVVTLDIIGEIASKQRKISNNYRKYHKLPTLRGTVKGRVRKNAENIVVAGTRSKKSKYFHRNTEGKLITLTAGSNDCINPFDMK